MSSGITTDSNTEPIPQQPHPVTSSAMGITVPHVKTSTSAETQENNTINSTNPATTQSEDINNNNTFNNPNPVPSSAMDYTVPPQQSSVVPEPAVRDQANFNPARNGYDLIDDNTVASDPSKGPLGKRIIEGQPSTDANTNLHPSTTNNTDPATTNTTYNTTTNANANTDNSNPDNTTADKKTLGNAINPTTASIKDKIKGGVHKLAAKIKNADAREE